MRLLQQSAVRIPALKKASIQSTYLAQILTQVSRIGWVGLEAGTYNAFTSQPGPFGNCGLSLQFAAGNSYNNSSWTISIPNPEGANYVANQKRVQF